MKKTSKLLSVLLAGIMLFSIFSVSASAKEMTKAEVVNFYHSILKKTAENNKLVLVKTDCKEKDSADFSGLSGLDKKFTENLYSYCDDLWYEYTTEEFLPGVVDSGDDAEDTPFYFEFSVELDLEWGGTVKNATYKDNKIVMEIKYEFDEEILSGNSTEKITVSLGKDNVINKITKETYDIYNETSLIKGTPFTATYEGVYTYTFTYEKVPVKSLTLSKTNLTLGYGDVAEIEYTVGPENATFKDVDVYAPLSKDGEIIAEAYEDDGKITIIGLSEGTGTVEVYTYSGDLLATCEVTVEFTFIEKILSKFHYFFAWLFLFLGENIDLI